MTPATTLERLTEDVFIIVLSYLDPFDVLRIRSVRLHCGQNVI